MQLGVTLPTKELGADLSALRDYAQAAEDLGFEFLMGYDQLLGSPPAAEGAREGFSWESFAYEPLLLFTFLSSATQRVQFLSGVIVAPQRPALLLAKQAADVAVISGGRLLLGLGVGANPSFYRALGQDFHTRGRRFEEQIELMRLLWSEPLVTYHGQFHDVQEVGINPRPPGGSIPIWIGTYAERTLERIRRLADGWVGAARSPRRLAGRRAIVDEAARRAGRDPSALGIHVQVDLLGFDLDRQLDYARRCAEAGVTHLSFNSMDCGLASAQEHIGRWRRSSGRRGRRAADPRSASAPRRNDERAPRVRRRAAPRLPRSNPIASPGFRLTASPIA